MKWVVLAVRRTEDASKRICACIGCSRVITYGTHCRQHGGEPDMRSSYERKRAHEAQPETEEVVIGEVEALDSFHATDKARQRFGEHVTVRSKIEHSIVIEERSAVARNRR